MIRMLSVLFLSLAYRICGARRFLKITILPVQPRPLSAGLLGLLLVAMILLIFRLKRSMVVALVSEHFPSFGLIIPSNVSPVPDVSLTVERHFHLPPGPRRFWSNIEQAEHC